MQLFEFTRASTVEDAVARSGAGKYLIAGGTNLVDLMKYGVVRPMALVDINPLPLAGIENLEAGGLRLGALATNAATAYNPRVRLQYPLLSDAILAGASAQLRNVATNGGNLNQRPRCPYFYKAQSQCNKRNPGEGCAALEGDTRMQAILGTSPNCIATFPSDMCAALCVLDARIQVAGPQGPRELALDDYFRLPGDEPWRENNLGANEVVTAIDLPGQGFARHYCYLKVRDRRSYAFAIVSAAVGMELREGVIQSIHVALGSVAAKPWRLPEAERLLTGQEPTKQGFLKLADALLDGAKAHNGNDFKIDLVRRTVVQACLEAAMPRSQMLIPGGR